MQNNFPYLLKILFTDRLISGDIERKINYILRIGYYSTVSTDDAVLVIGGYDSDFSSVVAEYKDGSWNNIGNLGRASAHHKTMRSGSDILILGGMWGHNIP